MTVLDQNLFFRIFGSGEPACPLLHPGMWCTPEEPRILLALSRACRSTHILEFGVNLGATAAMFLRNCPDLDHYTGVDVPPDFRPPLAIQQTEVPIKGMAGQMARDDPRFTLMLLPGGTRDLRDPYFSPPVDYVFIDADHSYEGVRRDTALAQRVLRRRGGVICWHDYRPDCPQLKLETVRAIDDMNILEKDRICWVAGTSVCFELIAPSLSLESNCGERPNPLLTDS